MTTFYRAWRISHEMRFDLVLQVTTDLLQLFLGDGQPFRGSVLAQVVQLGAQLLKRRVKVTGPDMAPRDSVMGWAQLHCLPHPNVPPRTCVAIHCYWKSHDIAGK